MIKILTLIGARPQIIKASAISREIEKNFKEKIQEIIVHTGQHYDKNMSGVFFDELDIPKPKYNLNVGSSTHAKQTAKIIDGLESIIINENIHLIILYGDTNSTLAGAICASKLNIPIAHVEAGLRSYNKNMPEEINRVLCDHVSTLLFSPTSTGIENLLNEGFKKLTNREFNKDKPGIFNSGDIMLDNALHFEKKVNENLMSKKFDFYNESYILLTIHRQSNTDNKHKLASIFNTIEILSEKNKIIIPLHPRTRKKLKSQGEIYTRLNSNKNIVVLNPLSYLEIIFLINNSSLIVTDSGGLQKEAYFFKKGCIIIREETEWKEIVEAESGILTGSDSNKILNAFNEINRKKLKFPKIFGNGNAANFILNKIIKNF